FRERTPFLNVRLDTTQSERGGKMRQQTIALFGGMALLTGLAAGALAVDKGKEAVRKSRSDKGDSETLFTLQGQRDTVWSVCFSPDGKGLASASKDRTA